MIHLVKDTGNELGIRDCPARSGISVQPIFFPLDSFQNLWPHFCQLREFYVI